jgi:AraC family transcriptional regulator
LEHRQEYAVQHTRREFLQNCRKHALTSEGLGWDVLFASRQREQPFEATLTETRDCLLILHRSGPVPVIVGEEGRGRVSQIRRRGQISLIPGNSSGYLHLRAAHDTLHVYLRSDLFDDRAGSLYPLLGIEDTLLDQLGLALAGILVEREPGAALCVDPIARAMAARILCLVGRAPGPGSAGSVSGIRLSRVLDLEADLSIAELASIGEMAARRLRASFQAFTGMTPYRYVVARRVERAKGLLMDRELSLAEIALRCGFCHQEHMTRIFREVTGVTPGKFRTCL